MKLESLPEDAVAGIDGFLSNYSGIIPCSENQDLTKIFSVAMRGNREISGKRLSFSQLLQTNMSREQFTKICCDFLAVESRKQIERNPSNGGIDGGAPWEQKGKSALTLL